MISDSVIRGAFKCALTVVSDAPWSLVSAFVAELNVSDHVVACCGGGIRSVQKSFTSLNYLMGILS